MLIRNSNIMDEVKKLDSLLNEYEEVNLNLFKQLDETTNNWQDNFSIQFNEEIYKEKNNNQMFINEIRNIKEIYMYVYNSYSRIGNEIYCNLNSKENVINKIDNSISELCQIAEYFHNIDTSFWYSEIDRIYEARSEVEIQISKLEELQFNISNFYKKIEKIEKEIKERLSKLELVNIKNFEFLIN